jgi:hypothetical protein
MSYSSKIKIAGHKNSLLEKFLTRFTIIVNTIKIPSYFSDRQTGVGTL